MILGIDTETTDLLKPLLTPLKYQPHIIEIGMVMLDDNFNQIGEYQKLFKPPIEIPFFIEKHTKITNEMVSKEKPFKKYTNKIKRIIQSAKLVYGQNMMFDYWIVMNEFSRLGVKVKFPKLFCCIEQSMHIRGRRLKNNELYELITGKQFKNAHRALNDIKATTEVFKNLYDTNKKKIRNPNR